MEGVSTSWSESHQNCPFTYSLLLSVHDSFQLLKMSKFDLQLLHLCLNQQGHQRLDLSLLHGSQVLSVKRNSNYLGKHLFKIEQQNAEVAIQSRDYRMKNGVLDPSFVCLYQTFTSI